MRKSEFRYQAGDGVAIISFHTWIERDRATARSAGIAIHDNADRSNLADFLNACLAAAGGDLTPLDKLLGPALPAEAPE